MTRQKKSRKPGALGAKSQPKNLREHKGTDTAPKPPKNKGKPPGNRHSVEPEKAKSSAKPAQEKDPRVGSKRKIELQAPAAQTLQMKAAAAAKPTARAPSAEQIAKVEPNDIAQAEDEFARLENDPRLQDLLAQIDAGDQISVEDSAWVDAQLDRYRQLADELGIDVDELEDEDEDDLEPWKKFDNPKDWV